MPFFSFFVGDAERDPKLPRGLAARTYIAGFTVIIASLFYPGVSFAQRTPSNFSDLVTLLLNIISVTIPLLAGLSILVFFWGLARFVLSAGGDERAHTEGKRFMLWGIIAMFVMMSVWGIVAVITNTLGISLFIPLLPTR